MNLNSKLIEFVSQLFSIRFKTNLNYFERKPERIKEQCYEYLQVCYTDQYVFICNSRYSATFSLRQLQIQYCSFLLQRVLSKRLQQCTFIFTEDFRFTVWKTGDHYWSLCYCECPWVVFIKNNVTFLWACNLLMDHIQFIYIICGYIICGDRSLLFVLYSFSFFCGLLYCGRCATAVLRKRK